MLAFAASGIVAAPTFAQAAPVSMQVTHDVQTDTADGSAGGATTSTTIVASEGPVLENQAGARSPSIGPVLVPTNGSSFTGAWWLIAFGGLQLVGLFFITRRARARLSTDDAQL